MVAHQVEFRETGQTMEVGTPHINKTKTVFSSLFFSSMETRWIREFLFFIFVRKKIFISFEKGVYNFKIKMRIKQNK